MSCERTPGRKSRASVRAHAGVRTSEQGLTHCVVASSSNESMSPSGPVLPPPSKRCADAVSRYTSMQIGLTSTRKRSGRCVWSTKTLEAGYGVSVPILLYCIALPHPCISHPPVPLTHESQRRRRLHTGITWQLLKRHSSVHSSGFVAISRAACEAGTSGGVSH